MSRPLWAITEHCLACGTSAPWPVPLRADGETIARLLREYQGECPRCHLRMVLTAEGVGD